MVLVENGMRMDQVIDRVLGRDRGVEELSKWRYLSKERRGWLGEGPGLVGNYVLHLSSHSLPSASVGCSAPGGRCA